MTACVSSQLVLDHGSVLPDRNTVAPDHNTVAPFPTLSNTAHSANTHLRRHLAELELHNTSLSSFPPSSQASDFLLIQSSSCSTSIALI